MSDYQPRPGDFFVVRTAGTVGAAIRLGTRSPVNHAGLVLDQAGTTIEAQPGGAVFGKVRGTVIRPPITPAVQNAVGAVGVHFRGIGYSVPGCAALGAERNGLGWLPGVQAKLADTDDLFCSQLVDVILHLAGFKLFDDGRAFGNVTPGDLLDVAVQRNDCALFHLGKINVPL